MPSHGPEGLHLPTLDDIRRLLACVGDLHAAPAATRGRHLAAAVGELLDADAVAVCVAERDAWTIVATETAGRGSAAERRTAAPPDAPPGAFAADAVGRVAPDETSFASLVSVRVGPAPATALVARRARAFDARHATLLRLLHPHVAWAVAPAFDSRGLPATAAAVLELMLVGLPEKEIAHRLGRSSHTVHGHVKRLYRHFDVSSRPQLILRLTARRSADV